jgi:hypothetical protein
VGTRTNPDITVAGVIELKAKALPIIIEPDKVTTLKEVTIPLITRIWSCKNSNELRDLENSTGERTPPPPLPGESEPGAIKNKATQQPMTLNQQQKPSSK